MTHQFLISYEILLLLIPLAFFLLIAIFHVLFPKSLSISKAWLTIKVAVFGILFTLLVRSLAIPPEFTPYIQEIQGLILLFCMGNVLAYLLVDIYLEYRMQRQVPSFLRDLLLLAVYMFVAATALRVVFDINLRAILAATTVLTAALAFALQSSLANVVSGFHIQADKNFKRGTWVWINDKDIYGEIVNVGFRYTTLKTMEQYLVFVPNNIMTQNMVHAIGKRGEGPAGVNLKVLLQYSYPPERAMAVLFNTLQDEPGILRDPAPSVRLDWLMENGVQYNLRFYLEDYGTVLMVRNRILMRVWYAVTREGFTFPFPHREIIMSESEPSFRLSAHGIKGNLRQIEILSPLKDEELDELAKRVHLRIFGNGETVVRQGEEGNSLYINLCGELEVYVDGIKVGMLRGGEFFGEMSLLTGEKRSATVRAVGEVWIIEITKGALDSIVCSNPSVAEGLSAALERRLEKIKETQLLSKTTPEVEVRSDTILVKIKNFFGIS
jgi:small-conductance mechanosensitive channel/CRP-like cAMP-binding protein